MEQIKAIAKFYGVEAEKITTRFMAEKLKELKLDHTGNKATQTERLFKGLKLEPIKEADPPKPAEKKEEKVVKGASFYARYDAKRFVTPGAEGPTYDWKEAVYVKTIKLSDVTAKELNFQKKNSGTEYRKVKSKEDK